MPISLFNEGIKNTQPSKEQTLTQVHNYITSEDAKEATITLRDVEQSDWAKDFKAKNFKFATFSGTFTKRNEGGLRAFSGFICIDIDEVTNIKDAKQSIIKDQDLQPALTFTSPSGNGIKAVYKVDPNLDVNAFPYAYDFIAETIENKFNVTADRLPKSVVSACFLPWDEDAYLNEEAALVNLPEFDLSNQDTNTHATSALQADDDAYKKADALISYLEDNKISIADSYQDWRNVGFALASFGKKGRLLFHRVSKLSSKYDHGENERQYDSCLSAGRGDITLGTFFHMVGEAGVPTGKVLKSFNKMSIITTKPEDFWSKKNQDAHTERAAQLIKEEGHPLVQWIMNQYSITHEQLCEYNVGLGQYSFSDGNIEDALFISHTYGVRVYCRDGNELTYEDVRGSHVTDSFFGTNHTANKSMAYVTNNPFEAIALSYDPKVDIICPLEYNGPKLGEKQVQILRDIGKYWKKVYVFRGADYGDEERQAREYVRSYSDALDRDTEVYWLNPVFVGIGKNVQPLQLLAYLSGENKTPKDIAEYVWNSWTKKYKFWFTGGVKTPKVDLDFNLLPKALNLFNINKVYFAEDEPTMIRAEENILENLSGHVLFDIIREEVVGRMSKYVDISSEETGSKLIPRSKLSQIVNKNKSLFLSDDFKAICGRKTFDMMKDTKDSAYLYFQNNVVKVTADNTTKLEYSELRGSIWKSQILDRAYCPSRNTKKGEFEQFVENICGGDSNRKKATMSCLGYNLHGYKDVGNARALILVDEFSSKGIHAGGTGKGIFAKSIRHIRQQGYIAGKNVKTDSQFLFMNVDLGDQSFHFEDVKEDFDFEVLFNAITDDLQVEKKGDNRFTIPFSQSPKFIISTNHIIKGKGHSYDRRQVVLPFSDYYGPHLNPQKEFGHNLFDDWNEQEWRQYDDFMIRCIKLYLKEGLIIPETGKFKVRAFNESTSKAFFDWAETWIERGREYDLRSLFRGDIVMPDGTAKVGSESHTKGQSIPAFLKLYPGELDLNQSKTFNSWMLDFGEFKGWTTVKRDSNGAVLIKFS